MQDIFLESSRTSINPRSPPEPDDEGASDPDSNIDQISDYEALSGSTSPFFNQKEQQVFHRNNSSCFTNPQARHQRIFS